MLEVLQNRKLLWLFFGLAVINLLLNNHSISFWDEDEAAYAGFAHRMIETGNYVVPEFTWSEPHRKTPLHFWAIVGSYQLFGENEFAVRFPSVLSVMLTCFFLYALGRNVFGENVSKAAALLMACSLLLPGLGKVSVTDALLTFFQTLAALAIINHFHAPNWRWAVLLWAAVAMGALVKGPPILILTFGMLGVLVVLHPHRWRLVSLHPWVGLPLALLPLWMWGRAAWLTDNGQYIQWMIDWYILKRAKGGTAFGQWGPPGYFLAVFFISFLPWAVFFPKSIGNFFKNIFKWPLQTTFIYLLAWFAAGWFLYELIPSKLPTYAMAAYAGVAVLLAKTALELSAQPLNIKKDLKWGLGLYLTFSLVLGLGLCVAACFLLDAWGIAVTAFTSSIWLVTGVVGWLYYRADNLYKGVLFSALQVLLFTFFAWLLIVPSFEYQRSATKRIAKSIAENSTNDTQVIMAHKFYPSLPFYLTKVPRKYRALNNDEFDQCYDFYTSQQKNVLVFEHSKFNNFYEGVKQQSLPYPVRVDTVRGWKSDMGKLAEYYLVYNY